MAEAAPIVFVLVVCAIVVALLVARQRRLVAALEAETAALENHIRTLDDQNRQLEQANGEIARQLAETQAALDSLRASHAELERQKSVVVTKLAALETENESLRRRVLEFQGHWSRQLTTVEEEIGTVMRQLGEFRRGTVLPIPDRPKADSG